MIRDKIHCMGQTQYFIAFLVHFKNLASLSSVVSICFLGYGVEISNFDYFS